MAATDVLQNGMASLQLNESQDGKPGSEQPPDDEFKATWGFSLEELYKISLKFYKEKSGKALQLTYKDKLKLVAYTKQVAFGKFRSDVSPEVGFLDVVGNDRKQAWQALGDMSRESAMQEFIKQLHKMCPLFQPYVEAHRAEREEQLRKQREEDEQRQRETEEQRQREMEDQARRQQEAQRQRQIEQEMQIKAALNQQTADQFRAYARQQYPNNQQMQDQLILQLQDQHFQQYMQQVYQQQILHQQQQYQQLQAMQASSNTTSTITTTATAKVIPTPTANTPDPNANSQPSSTQLSPTHEQANGPLHLNGDSGDDELPPIAAASMWTRKDYKEFKASLQKDKDSVIKIGSGETVTVRVPTHEDGTCLFWEFATDYYDIGFGVYFEWTIAPSNTVSVHVSDSSDEDELEEEGEGAGEGKVDVESGKKHDDRPPTDEIIPVYRRDCHEEVYCGSHTYPGRGVYLLKFDNSYSLWRSKTLYYRVYYSR